MRFIIRFLRLIFILISYENNRKQFARTLLTKPSHENVAEKTKFDVLLIVTYIRLLVYTYVDRVFSNLYTKCWNYNLQKIFSFV